MTQPLKIALVKQDVYQDLYVCPHTEKDALRILLSSQVRVGPIALMADLGADFYIVKEESAPETQFYRYVIPHMTPYLRMLKDHTLKVDTIITQKQSIVLGETNIFSYDESYAETEKYKMQKITGLRSVTLRHGTDYKNLNLTKDTAYFKTEKDTCYLIVTENMFASTTKK